MMQQSVATRLQSIDDWRVAQHFKRVETILRNQDVSHLPQTQQRARESYIEKLHDYAARGIFPRNYEQPDYAPCFIDRDGRECAVAHLVMSSGQAELAHKIAAVSNYAYVPEIESPELDDWAAQAGLSPEELALIQPSYYYTQLFTASFFLTALSVWAVGLLVALMNGFFILRRKKVMGIPMLGLFVAAVPVFFGISCFNAATTAYDFAQQRNSPFYQAASHDIGPFALSAVVSIVIAMVIPVLSLNRIRDYLNSVREEFELGDADEPTD